MKKRFLTNLVLISTLIIFSLSPFLLGQGQDEGYVSVQGDTEMIGAGSISGGGHVTWVFTGDQAKELRRYILQMFDNSTLPCYFVAAKILAPTSCPFVGPVPNGNLDETEVARYLELVDQWLESSFSTTDRYRYYVIGRADTLYEEVTASVEGLINTPWDLDIPVEIQFIYNSEVEPGMDIFPLAETQSLNAIYDIFSVDMLQDFETSSKPFSTIDWMRTDLENSDTTGTLSLWHGNATTGEYENNVTSVATAKLDLRYASYGNLSFKYIGSVADNNDVLNVSISEDGSTWHNILSLSQPNNTATWKDHTFDLANNQFGNFIGKEVLLALNFSSDLTGNDTGFFLDEMYFYAPSRYDGEVRYGYVDYIVGLSSFQDPIVRSSNPHIFRLLGGEVLLYSATYNTSNVPGDTITYDSFNVLENPAVLFVIMFICVWFMISLPNKFYSDYKIAHEPNTRYTAEKIKWLHWVGRILIIFTLLFYFFPTMLAGIGVSFIGGAVMIAMSVIFLVSISLGAKFLYDRKISQLPTPEMPMPTAGPQAEAPGAPGAPVPPGALAKAPGAPSAPLPLGALAMGPVPVGTAPSPESTTCPSCHAEIPDDEMAQCGCGTNYHQSCASSIGNCISCGQQLMVTVEKKGMVSVECPSCKETTTVKKDANLIKEKCPECGLILKKTEKGYNYLFIDITPEIAYHVFNGFIKENSPALCLSTSPKEKLVKKYNLGEAKTYWLTTMSTSEHTLDPKRMDFEVMRSISSFMKENDGGVVLIDGVEHLISENGFEATSVFMKKVMDMASVYIITLIVPVSPSNVEKEGLGTLWRDFDRVEDMTEPKADQNVVKEIKNPRSEES